MITVEPKDVLNTLAALKILANDVASGIMDGNYREAEDIASMMLVKAGHISAHISILIDQEESV